jgi:hypothetical protein
MVGTLGCYENLSAAKEIPLLDLALTLKEGRRFSFRNILTSFLADFCWRIFRKKIQTVVSRLKANLVLFLSSLLLLLRCKDAALWIRKFRTSFNMDPAI